MQGSSDYSARRSVVWGLLFSGVGAISAIALLLPGSVSSASNTIWGFLFLAGTSLFVIDWFWLSRISVSTFGIRRIERLGVKRDEWSLDSLREIRFGTRAGAPFPLDVIELRFNEGSIVINRSLFGTRTIRSLIRHILINYPSAPVSHEVRAWYQSVAKTAH